MAYRPDSVMDESITYTGVTYSRLHIVTFRTSPQVNRSRVHITSASIDIHVIQMVICCLLSILFLCML